MECNKDEALRAKEISEKKFTSKDIVGAKKFAMKAHSLYPELEGISQMLATFDVYLSAENKINGETDWYAVLSVNASADDETVKKQYRKLALALHPDKNKSIGADGAFKILSEAWSVLSDKGRRLTFDQKTKSRGQQNKTSQSNRNVSASKSNGFRKANNSSSSKIRSQNINKSWPAPPPPTTNSRPAPPPPVSGSSSFSQLKPTFWTECHRCKTQYEYPRVYLNHKLLCPNCREEFFAEELPNPPNGSHSTQFSSRQQKPSQNASSKNGSVSMNNSTCAPSVGATRNSAAQTSFNEKNHNCSSVNRSTGVESNTASSAAAEAARVIHQTADKMRKERGEFQASSKSEDWNFQTLKRVFSSVNGSFDDNVSNIPEKLVKKRKAFDDKSRGVGSDFAVDNSKYGFGASKNLSDSERAYSFSRGRYSGMTDFSAQEIRNLLLEKSRKAIVKEVSEIKLKKDKTKKRSEVNADKFVEDKEDATLNEKSEHHGHVSGDSGSNSAVEQDEPGAISVPDPDFHDFDMDRVEASFDANQVWAAYDDDDGMPRYYALIHKVLSLKPFKMQFSWLNSKSSSELGPLNWVASGYSKSCGEFRVGRYEVSNTVNMFSHKVIWEKGIRGVVKVFPKKADVWALYRNWSPDWNESTPDDVIHKYDMVEVLEDYNEEAVLVAPLVKVAGFKTVFHRNMDPKEIKRIPREEMFRFSHQVPSCLLSGEEAPTAPKGCRELDPAATPLELLQVITETKEKVEAPSMKQGEEYVVKRDEQKPKS